MNGPTYYSENSLLEDRHFIPELIEQIPITTQPLIKKEISETSTINLSQEQETITPVSLTQFLRINIPTTTPRLPSNYNSHQNYELELLFEPEVKRKLHVIQSELIYESYKYKLNCLKQIKKCLNKTKDTYFNFNQSQLDQTIAKLIDLTKKAKKEYKKQKLQRLYHLLHLN
ncbi:hypothetical protein EHI8A_013380 [Entamoeba histolytica HM-1:IMSS-B]|uniref:Uncharacterized protein n=6 Tax=Entamoeba histolytica TaxID=5759 RepID=C4LVF9_ENTH1|nr:hypothetical protein EHI_197430 [Entamoeba histolytica HM-1:IMSS]EMD49578.1 Hypothetical protein EHI5A_005620 [Entamoeba histolytica KU27]EMH73740.1 hypothetical protein EHI8A_013380 [Entamoeba histolytica HM-1:IMSS-B]EMS17840.1 hypothetical protein KM1_041490 [Entamoeba histolytica HM-3:IMSS]ENY65453.1 hypothetical protein EHI7A_017320 [Entamoeba histolytica HM-1:IMSS-A]EAL46297.1 hypothetical protein EHI_197430 [Entamoeba histolytica HM-1:IMSS]|eukprot:XP_651684.1 hypothetical protein EHI_197430 [Entamoeba histolytica HM-1:IMSS]